MGLPAGVAEIPVVLMPSPFAPRDAAQEEALRKWLEEFAGEVWAATLGKAAGGESMAAWGGGKGAPRVLMVAFGGKTMVFATVEPEVVMETLKREGLSVAASEAASMLAGAATKGFQEGLGREGSGP